MVFDKARPLRRTESPKGASPNNRSARRTKDDEPTEKNGHAQPCVPEGGEYRTVQLLHRWAFRWSTGLPDFTVSPIYQFTSLPINQSTGIRWASPSGGVPLRYWAIRRFVGQALLTLRLLKCTPFGGRCSLSCCTFGGEYQFVTLPRLCKTHFRVNSTVTVESQQIAEKLRRSFGGWRSFIYFCDDVLRERLTGNWNAYLSPEAH